jgi:hypothetical protein
VDEKIGWAKYEDTVRMLLELFDVLSPGSRKGQLRGRTALRSRVSVGSTRRMLTPLELITALQAIHSCAGLKCLQGFRQSINGVSRAAFLR